MLSIIILLFLSLALALGPSLIAMQPLALAARPSITIIRITALYTVMANTSYRILACDKHRIHLFINSRECMTVAPLSSIYTREVHRLFYICFDLISMRGLYTISHNCGITPRPTYKVTYTFVFFTCQNF